MKDTCYIIVTRNGIQRMTKRPPRQESGEFAFELPVEIDDAYFERRFPRATLKIGPEHLIDPTIQLTAKQSLDYMIHRLIEELKNYMSNGDLPCEFVIEGETVLIEDEDWPHNATDQQIKRVFEFFCS